MRGGLFRVIAAAALAGIMSHAPDAAAQQLGVVQSPILTIEPDRLFAETAYGQSLSAALEAEAAALAAENRRIESALTKEEQALTDRRPEMSTEDFRAEADGFDARVQQIRSEQDAKARALAQQRDEAPARFFQAAAPVLEKMMRDAGAAVILERVSVFLSANATDITQQAIARIDAALVDRLP